MDQAAVARDGLVEPMNDEGEPRASRDELVRSYRHCRRLAAEANSTFARMFWLLPQDQRRAMEALYAFARQTDDLADGPESADEKQWRLMVWQEELEHAIGSKSQIPNPKSQVSSPSVLPAIADTVQRFEIPHDYLRQVIQGVEMDLRHTGFETFADLRHYCVRVASSVGLSCLAIWGCQDQRAAQPATDCGIAFQLTNILRDLAEDAARGRLYLPREDLRRFECEPTDLVEQASRNVDHWTELIKFEAAQANDLFDASAATERHLSGSGRRMFRLMHATYRALLAKIERNPVAVLTRRLRVSRPQKAWIVLRTLVT
jgi:15-cis-phytoene synthase